MFFPYKDDNPTDSKPIVTVALIAINVLVFVWSHVLSPDTRQVIVMFGSIPGNVTGLGTQTPTGAWPPLTLLTSMFLHGGPAHLIGNMWFLWLFGDNVEDKLGKVLFVVFYLGCGLAAEGAHILSDPRSMIPTIGASGAISGVMGAYIILHPKANIRSLLWLYVFIRRVDLPAWIYLGVWFGWQIFSAGRGGGIAWWAHIGGFAAGSLALVAVAALRGESVRLSW